MRDGLDASQKCYQVSGDDDYLLKVRCASLAPLANLVTDVLPRLTGGGRIRSIVILTTIKKSPIVPLPEPPATAVNPKEESRV